MLNSSNCYFLIIMITNTHVQVLTRFTVFQQSPDPTITNFDETVNVNSENIHFPTCSVTLAVVRYVSNFTEHKITVLTISREMLCLYYHGVYFNIISVFVEAQYCLQQCWMDLSHLKYSIQLIMSLQSFSILTLCLYCHFKIFIQKRV